MSAATATPPPPADDARVDGRTWLAVFSAMLGAFMALLDIGITNSSLQNIMASLSATHEEGSWISTAYLAAEVVAIPLASLFARGLGLRNYLVGNAALFLVFSGCCGAAWNLQSMIVFRMLQGFASGALIPMAMTMVVLKLPAAKRAAGLGLFGLTAMLAPTIGPTVGGYISDAYGWPWIFYINLVPGALLIGGILSGLDRDRVDPRVLWNGDWLGVACMALGLGSLTVFLEEGQSHDWFSSGFVVGAAVLGLAGLLAWVVNSAFRAEPFVDLAVFGRRNFVVAAVLAAVTGVGLYGTSFILPLYLGQIANYTPTQIGEVIMWAGWPQLFVMPLAARLSSRVDNRILCSIGLGLFGCSCLMNVSMDATTGRDQLLAAQVVRALGQPFIVLTIGNFALAGVTAAQAASASSLYNMMRNLGGSCGVALLATSLTTREQLHSLRVGESVSAYSPLTQARLDGFAQGFVAHGADPAGAASKALLALDAIVRREAFVMAYNDCFWIIGMIFLSCIALLWLADDVKSASGTHARQG